jgi:DNA-directed RNA polymerase specialized sigma24 family protein
VLPHVAPRDIELLRLDAALNRLAALDPVKARLVELRHFGGLTTGEAARVLGVSRATINREWSLARAWLYRYLTG